MSRRGHQMQREISAERLVPTFNILLTYVLNMVPAGFQPRSCSTPFEGSARIVWYIYRGLAMPTVPLSDKTPHKLTRNDEIRRGFASGESTEGLARYYGISRQRVYQIIHVQHR